MMLKALFCDSRTGLRVSLLERKAALPSKRSTFRVTVPVGANTILQSQRAHFIAATRALFVQPCRTLAHSHNNAAIIPCSSCRTYVTSNQLSSSTSFPDPDRPGLFYHLFEPPTPASNELPVFALSFLSEKPSSADSCAIIGWLPAATASEADEAGLNDFKENQKFVGVLHEAIHSALRDGVDDIQKNAAIQTQQGWMHIHDMRNVPALGRIGDPDDIIASVRVEDGQILAETYQPMPSYRLCTSDGIMQLTDGLAERLMEVLAQRTKTEAKSQRP